MIKISSINIKISRYHKDLKKIERKWREASEGQKKMEKVNILDVRKSRDNDMHNTNSGRNKCSGSNNL